jgi:hypothetical protein
VAAPLDLPVHVLAAVVDTMQDLDDIVWEHRPPAVMLAMVRSLERLRSVLDGIELSVVAGIESTQAAATDGWASTKDFVTAATGGPKGSGRRVVNLAHALAGDRSETGRHLGAGWISRVQAEVVVEAVDRLPGNPGLRTAAEKLLLEQARDLDATDLARLGRGVVERLDPDGEHRRDERALEREERAAHHSRFLCLREDGMGGVRLTGRGTVEDAAWLKTVLMPLAAPQPTSPPGACGGTPGTVRSDQGCGLAECAHDGRDPREAGARLWDALVDALRRLAGTDQLPQSHGATPRVTVTVDHDTLRTGVGEAGLLDFGTGLSAAAVRRLACDAEILPMVLGSQSQVLDVGRSSRLVTPGIWLALVARDRHCAFPGCTRMPIACDAHHLRHWADGGSTALDNLVLLCRSHHTVLHATPWQVSIAPDDRRPVFHPPPGRHRRPKDQQLRGRRPQRE